MRVFERIVQRLGGVLVTVAGLCLLAMVVVVDANVIGRATWGSILGTFELTGLIACLCIAFAIGYTEIRRAHVVIPVLVGLFRPRVQAILGAIAPAIAIIAALLIAVPSILYLIKRVLPFYNVTQTLGVPIAPFLIWWIIGLLILSIILLAHFIEAIQSVVKK